MFTFLDNIGLVATDGGTSVGYHILDAFGLIVTSPDKAYEVGFGVFNMVGALVQFFGVICLSEFLANKIWQEAYVYRMSCADGYFHGFVLFPFKIRYLK